MYAKLFTSIYQGTLRGNSLGLLVFTNLLAHADSAGCVDVHPKAIAEEVGLTIEDVRAVLIDLETPDKESRSPEMEGRRIVRMDEHRAWGWRIVNYAKYRAIRNEDDRREQNRLAQEKWRKKNKQSKPRKPQSAQAEAEAEAEAINTETSSLVVTGPVNDKYHCPPSPNEDLEVLYSKNLPMLPQISVLNANRKRALAARWREVCAAEKLDRERGLEWFDAYFKHVSKSAFLTGKSKPNGSGRVWKADFDWIINATNFAKIYDGRYHQG